MSDKNSKKIGLGIGIISRGTVPLRWALKLKNIGACVPGGMYWDYVTVEGKSWAEARTLIVEKAMKKNFKWLFFLDDDVLCPDDIIRTLLSRKKDIITGVYWTKSENTSPVIFKEFGNGPYYDFEPDQVFKIDGAGLGCTLINLEVFDKFKEKGIPFFKENWVYQSKGHGSIRCPVGEDHYFFIHARELGYDVWCDSGILCDHYCVKTNRSFPPQEIVREICQTQLKKAGKEKIVEDHAKLLSLDPDKKTIAFINHVASSFTGDEDEKRGIGGSEGAIIFLARQLADKGFNVHVFCNCSEPGSFKGVMYHHMKDLHQLKSLKADHVIVSRNCDIVSLNDLKKQYDCEKLYLWLHDMPDSPTNQSFPEALEKVDKVILLTEFHKNAFKEHFKLESDHKLEIIGNGCSVEYFQASDVGEVRDWNKLIYASTPFRGLDVLLDIFPEIKKQVPEATLDVYSSMLIYGNEFHEADEQYKILYDKAKEMDGVSYKGSVPKIELGKAMRQAGVLAYPTAFPETYCITAVEAHSAGLPIISSMFGALPETCLPMASILVEGLNTTTDYRNKFIEEVVGLLKDKDKQERMSQAADKVITWKDRATEWIFVFGEGGKEETVNEWDMGQPTDGVNSKEYWDQVYKKEFDSGYSRTNEGRFKLLYRMIQENTESADRKFETVLDVGCGTGEFTDYLKKQCPHYEIWGADISHIAIDIARTNNKKVFYSNHPLSAKDFAPDYFDVVVCSHTLEHIKKPEEMLERFKRILKKDAFVIIVLPYKDDPYHEHFHIFDRVNSAELMEGCGYEVIESRVKEMGQYYKDGREMREIILLGRLKKNG